MQWVYDLPVQDCALGIVGGNGYELKYFNLSLFLIYVMDIHFLFYNINSFGRVGFEWQSDFGGYKIGL